ncbi:MAG: hypothetical protein LBS48_02540, partial [Treponema sp.]|nr:hypothetical protein [Treponema sp.]
GARGGGGPQISLTTARTADSSAFFEESDPERRSYEENRYISAYRDLLGINITFKWIAPDGDSANVRWNTAIASGDIPDFGMVSRDIWKQLYEAGLLADMKDIYAKTASPELKKITSPSSLDYLTVDGKMYGFPVMDSNASEGVGVIHIRADWAQQLGLRKPKTFQDVIDMARAFKNAKLGGADTFGILLENKGYGGLAANWGGIINAWNAYINMWIDVNGQAVWSDTQPEMRQALLNMQALYKEGIFNRDFTVIDSATARQYLSTGKVGIAASGLTRLVVDYPALYSTDPKADTWSVIPTAADGSLYKVQIGQPTPLFEIVSAKTKNPEAVVELANLTVKLNNEDPDRFFRSTVNGTAWPWFKYNIMGGINISGPFLQIETANAIINTEKTGDMKHLPSGPIKEYYDRYTQGKTDRSMFQWVKMYEDGGSASAAYDAYHANRMVWSLFFGIPSDNMQLKQTIINNELKAAMDEVVMGADISVYDAAVRKWFASGGQEITDEVNAWYKAQKK